MDLALSIIALLLVAVTMGLSLAHALEFPGTLRLDEAQDKPVRLYWLIRQPTSRSLQADHRD